MVVLYHLKNNMKLAKGMRTTEERKRKKKLTASWRRRYYYNRKLAHRQIYDDGEAAALTAIKTLSGEVVTKAKDVVEEVGLA